MPTRKRPPYQRGRAGDGSTSRVRLALGCALVGGAVFGIGRWLHDTRAVPRDASAGSSQQGATEATLPVASLRDATSRAPASHPPAGAASVRATPLRHVATPGQLHGTIYARNGAPIAGAEACVASSIDDGLASRCTTTDDDGAFQLPRAGAGDVLIASASAYQTGSRVLPAAAERTAIDMVLLPSRAPSVRGVVLDATGGSVPGALILAHGADDPSPAAATRSDASGHFELALAPGRVTLEARAEAYAASRAEIEAPAEGVELLVAAGAMLSGDVIEDGSGRPVAGISVSAYAATGAHPSARTITSDANGHFVLTGLHAGRYSVRAADAQWAGDEVLTDIALGQASTPLLLRVRAATELTGVIRAGGKPCADGAVWLRGPTVSGVRTDGEGAVTLLGVLPGEYQLSVGCTGAVPLEEPLSVGREPIHRDWDLDTGVVLRGRLERASGAALQAPLRLYPKAESDAPRVPVDCSTDAEGAFECSGLQAGRYEVVIDGPTSLSLDSVVIADDGAEPPPRVLRLPPVASISVELAGGSASTGALHVFARRPGAPAIVAERNADGYAILDAPLGTYTIYVGPTSRVPADAPIVTLGKDGETARVTLSSPPTLSISGVALDAAGMPVPETWLHAESATADLPGETAGSPVLTNERGEFSLEGLLPGDYDIFGSASSALIATAPAGARGLALRLREP